MMIFWLLVAGLTGLALLFIVPPILRGSPKREEVALDDLNLAVFRQQLKELEADLEAGNLDQTRYEAARHDLERELLEDVSETPTSDRPQPRSGRWAAAVLALAVPALAVGLYQHLGQQDIIQRLEAAPPPIAADAAGQPHQDLPPMDVLVERLAEKMEQDPENVQGWLMLGRSYFSIRQPEKGLAAYERAYALAPNEPEVLLGYAEALSIPKNNDLRGKPEELIRQALAAAPGNPNALWMMGLASYQKSDFTAAVEHWETLHAMLQSDSEQAANLTKFIAQARDKAGLPLAEAPVVTTVSAPPVQNTQPAASGKSITVDVELDEGLAGEASATDIVFVYAKAMQGPPMPLAVQRVQVRDLPRSVTLDDSMAMAPQMTLSTFPQVVVGARVSKTGTATPQPGDLQGEVSPVEPGQAAAVRVVIDQRRP